MKFIKRLFLAFSFFIVLSLLAVLGGYFYLNNNLLPIDTKDKTNIIFRITEGESLSQTLKKLIDKKLIKDYNSARILSLVKFSGKHAKPGHIKFQSLCLLSKFLLSLFQVMFTDYM